MGALWWWLGITSSEVTGTPIFIKSASIRVTAVLVTGETS